MNREQATNLANSALDELVSALNAGRSDTLVRDLNMLSRFHRYSFQNCMLIALQRPDATYVAGFTRWKELGRHERKDERGIGILAPLLYWKTGDGEDTGDDDQDRRVIRGFKVVYVFDVSQTEGSDLPEFAPITGEPGEQVGRLDEVIRKQGIELEYRDIPGGALGTSAGGKITVLPDLNPAERFSVLAHELAHELLHRTERRAETTRTIRETEAETVAFAVCCAAGLDTGTRSSDYIHPALLGRPGRAHGIP